MAQEGSTSEVYFQGARADASRGEVTFTVYSQRALRIELFLYRQARDTDESDRRILTQQGNGLWGVSIPCSD